VRPETGGAQADYTRTESGFNVLPTRSETEHGHPWYGGYRNLAYRRADPYFARFPTKLLGMSETA